MKELRYFYAPEALTDPMLPADEASHALRVLRLREGDELHITDGNGHLIVATITEAHKDVCRFNINKVEEVARPWPCGVHLAVAPTKNIDRMEWLVEKATEIGVDSITFLDCANSERRIIKPERLDKIVVAAMKQSHKCYKPQITDIIPFGKFVECENNGQWSTPKGSRADSENEVAMVNGQCLKFIAHCYDDSDLLIDNAKPFLLDAIKNSMLNAQCSMFNIVVLVGPEGDFSPEEVRLAIRKGYMPVSLGQSRLRTETAALVAVHLMQLAQLKTLPLQ